MGQRVPGGPREISDSYYATVLSVYAPTAKAPSQYFSENLQNTVDKIPASNVMILLGDFSMHMSDVGNDSDSDLWQESLRVHRLESLGVLPVSQNSLPSYLLGG